MKSTYLLLLPLCCATMGMFAQTVKDSVRTVDLDEVVVKAKRVIHKGDHDVLYLTKQNRNFGTNALDAVSSLMLFKSGLNQTQLTSFDRQEVYVLINGIPSTAIDLRTYKADDIKHVEYYSVTPPQYIGLASGPVVNVVFKKRHDRLYSGYFNTLNAVNIGYGDNQASLTYADSLNQVKLDYFVGYRNIGDKKITTDYVYNPRFGSHYEGTDRTKGQYHRINTSYQRYQGRHLFSTKLYATLSPDKRVEERTGHIHSETDDYLGNGESVQQSRSNTVALDLYYQYNLKKSNLFAINLVNTLGNAYSDARQRLQSPTDADSPYNYDVHSRFDNDTYSGILSAVYSAPLWRGRLSASGRYEYKHLTQKVLGVNAGTNSRTGMFYTAWSGQWKGGTFYPAIGVMVMDHDAGDISRNSVIPYFRLYTDWWGKGKLEGLTAQLTLTQTGRSPSLRYLSESATYMDKWLVSVGNPGVKNYWESSAKLALGYYPSGTRNDISFILRPAYADKPFVSTFVKGQDGITTYLQPQNIDGKFDMMMYLTGTLFPFPWLSVAPYVEYYSSRFDTPLQQVRWKYWRAGGHITGLFKKWDVSLYANSPTQEYDGDLLSRGSWQFAAEAQYKTDSWSVGARYNYAGHHDYAEALLPGFSYYQGREVHRMHTQFNITASYSFSVGRSRRHGRRMLEEKSTDTGLGKYNSVQKDN